MTVMTHVIALEDGHTNLVGHLRLFPGGGGGGGGTPNIFHIHMCRQNALLFDDFSLAGHLK